MFAAFGTWLYQRLAGLMPLSRGYDEVLVAPQVSMGKRTRLNFGVLLCVISWNTRLKLSPHTTTLTDMCVQQIVNNSRVPSVSARLATPRGPVVVSWSYGTSVEPNASTCGEAEEAPAGSLNYVSLGCGDSGATIDNVTFASFGTASGSCASGSFQADPACNSPESVAVVASACLGQAACAVPVSDAAFGGDPCPGTKKWLAVQVRCTVAPQQWSLLQVNASLPVGASALVALPLQRPDPDPTLNVTEGGVLVWTKGAFVQGAVPGVLGGELLSQPLSFIPAVGFRVAGGGRYAFVAVAELP
jgi:hypothetical protein